MTNVCELWFWSPSVLQACGAVRWSGLKVKNSFRPFPNHGRNVGTKIAFRRAGGERWRRKSGFGVYWNVMESFKGVTERILKGGGGMQWLVERYFKGIVKWGLVVRRPKKL